MSQSQLQAHSNPFAAPSDSLESAVIWNPSRPLYESLRIAQIAFTVVAAYVLLMPFRLGSIEGYRGKLGALAIVVLVVIGTGCILMRELRTYWSEDAAKERKVIRIHSAYSLFLLLLALIGLRSYMSVITLALAAAWHITTIFRDSMLRQRLQFAVAQSGNPSSTSLHVAATSQETATTDWDASVEVTDHPAKAPEERRRILLAWLGQLLFSKRGLCMMGAAAGLMFGAVLLANSLIPVEVAGYQVNSDADSVAGVLHARLGGLYAKSIESWEQLAADGSWEQVEVIREVRVGSSTAILFGEPSVQYGGGPYWFTFYVGNRIVAQYDGEARAFHVPDLR